MFGVGWDRLDRVTLRFADPELERAYQDADRVAGVARARAASLLAVGVWVGVAVIGPPSLRISGGPVWIICGAMTVFLLGCAYASRWATNEFLRGLIGLGQIGYIKAIQVKLDEIGNEYPEHADFVLQMRSLVDGFDLDQYMATLKTLHSYDH